VPTNFEGMLRKPVKLAHGEICCWERHLKWGSAPRSLWRQLNKLDSVQAHGLCYSAIKTLQAGSAKFEDGKKVGRYSYDTIQNLLLDFERAGLAGPSFEEDEGPLAGLLVFQVHGQRMHDFLCERDGNICRYIGWSRAVRLAKGTP